MFEVKFCCKKVEIRCVASSTHLTILLMQVEHRLVGKALSLLRCGEKDSSQYFHLLHGYFAPWEGVEYEIGFNSYLPPSRDDGEMQDLSLAEMWCGQGCVSLLLIFNSGL